MSQRLSEAYRGIGNGNGLDGRDVVDAPNGLPEQATKEIVFTKHDGGKLRYSLIPPLAEQEMVKVLTFGANKYSANNWKNCDDTMRYVDATLRHIAAYRLGDTKDSESGMHHLAHAMCCLSFIVDMEMDTEVEF